MESEKILLFSDFFAYLKIPSISAIFAPMRIFPIQHVWHSVTSNVTMEYIAWWGTVKLT